MPRRKKRKRKLPSWEIVIGVMQFMTMVIETAVLIVQCLTDAEVEEDLNTFSGQSTEEQTKPPGSSPGKPDKDNEQTK